MVNKPFSNTSSIELNADNTKDNSDSNSDTNSIELDIINISGIPQMSTGKQEDTTDTQTAKDNLKIKKSKILITSLLLTILIISIAVFLFLKKDKNTTNVNKEINFSNYYVILDPVISTVGKNKSIKLVLIIECKNIKFKEKIEKNRLIILESIKNQIKTDLAQKMLVENNHELFKDFLKNHINSLFKKPYVSNIFYSVFLILNN